MSHNIRASARGGGRIFKPKNSRFWHCAFYYGREIRESTHVEFLDPDPKDQSRKAALRYLKSRIDAVIGERHGGEKVVTPAMRNVTINEQLDGLKADYEARGKWNPRVTSTVKILRAEFGHLKGVNVTKAVITSWMARLAKDGYRAASVNRLVQVLVQSFTIAEREAPKVPRLSEAGNVRTGFFEHDDLCKVLAALPEDLRDFVRFASITGWRKSACAGLLWEHVAVDRIVLPASLNKNKIACSVPLVGELQEIVARRRDARVVKSKDAISLSQYVFHRKGAPIRDFRKLWNAAFTDAGVPRKIFHDLRRTAARNLVSAGVPESVAMSITNHRTRSMFTRYAITSEAQRSDALLAVAELHRTKASEAKEARPSIQ
jgi:integrase